MGSLNVVTNEQGNVTEEQSFDAWGRRRKPQNRTYNNVPASYKFYRGYTGHSLSTGGSIWTSFAS
jgi:hypothetical protein